MKNFRATSTVVLAFVISIAASLPRAQAGEWKCGAASPSYAPKWTDSTLSIGLTSTCTATEPNKQGFTSLNELFLLRLKTIGVVKSGPVAKTLKGLPGQVWIMEDKFSQGGDTIRATAEHHIATDLLTRLISQTVSQKVEGSGDSKYITYYDNVVDVTSADAQKFTVKLTSQFQLKKPLLVPKDKFQKEAVKGTTSAFTTGRDLLLEQVADAI